MRVPGRSGHPTRRGGAWVPKTLSDVMRNPVLAGRRTDGQGRTILRVPPILDVDTWRKLQAEMDRRATKKGAVRAGSPLLSGVVVCHGCGGPMYRLRAQNTRKDGSKQYNVYYRCWGTDTNPSKCRNMFPLDELDAWVEARMAKTQFPRHEIVVTPGMGTRTRSTRSSGTCASWIWTRRTTTSATPCSGPSGHAAGAPGHRRQSGAPQDRGLIGHYWATLQTESDKRAFLLKQAWSSASGAVDSRGGPRRAGDAQRPGYSGVRVRVGRWARWRPGQAPGGVGRII